ncbi:MAG: dockerin type I domain-containing protein [Planctomycetota bacterium]
MTGEPEDDRAGFLPKNDSTGIGEGYVSFRMATDETAEVDDDENPLENDATITFDVNGPITTDPTRHLFSSMVPGDPSLPRPVAGEMDVASTATLEWARADRATSYSVFVWPSDEARPASAISVSIGSHLPTPSLQSNTEYNWQVVAENALGSNEGPVWNFSTGETSVRFVRGDVNVSGVVDLSDSVFALDYLFDSRGEPECLDAADVNDDGRVDISDPIALLSWLFLGGPGPPAPSPNRPSYNPDSCGEDLTSDIATLGCSSFDRCTP